MGRDIDTTEFERKDWNRYRKKLKSCLSALRTLVEDSRLEQGRRLVGVEMEASLADRDSCVLPINAEVLDRLEPGTFQTELARFTVEFSLAPTAPTGKWLGQMERDLRRRIDQTQAAAAEFGGHMIAIGVLPTITPDDLDEKNLSANARYRALNDTLLAARGENFLIHIDGEESLREEAPSILYEAACTATQLHLQVDPQDSARYWNAAQALSAPLVAVAANSPLFLLRQLHHETRIELFLQAIDTRPEELVEQGVRPRVWFGERWLRSSVLELFEENVRYFPPLLPICEEEDPQEVLASGGVPALAELTLHNGTIYRWNRPVYEVHDGVPHFRIENRVLPAGPSVPDTVANVALFCGLVQSLANADRPVWEEMSFEVAAQNFAAAARYGLGARLYWPRVGAGVPVGELLLRHLIPLARAGLRDWGLDDADIDHYLGIIEARSVTGRNGAAWQISMYRALVERCGMDRAEAARELVQRYVAWSRRDNPVHTWPDGCVEG
jgi:hypothetical protein